MVVTSKRDSVTLIFTTVSAIVGYRFQIGLSIITDCIAQNSSGLALVVRKPKGFARMP